LGKTNKEQERETAKPKSGIPNTECRRDNNARGRRTLMEPKFSQSRNESKELVKIDLSRVNIVTWVELQAIQHYAAGKKH